MYVLTSNSVPIATSETVSGFSAFFKDCKSFATGCFTDETKVVNITVETKETVQFKSSLLHYQAIKVKHF